MDINAKSACSSISALTCTSLTLLAGSDLLQNNFKSLSWGMKFSLAPLNSIIFSPILGVKWGLVGLLPPPPPPIYNNLHCDMQ